jgi:hypothetical protein
MRTLSTQIKEDGEPVILVDDVRGAAQRIADICRERSRRPCPDNCPGEMHCTLKRRERHVS